MSLQNKFKAPLESIRTTLHNKELALLHIEGQLMPTSPNNLGKTSLSIERENSHIKSVIIPALEDQVSSCKKAIEILATFKEYPNPNEWPQPLDVVVFQFRQYQLLKIRHNGSFFVGAVMNLNTYELDWLPIEELTKPDY